MYSTDASKPAKKSPCEVLEAETLGVCGCFEWSVQILLRKSVSYYQACGMFGRIYMSVDYRNMQVPNCDEKKKSVVMEQSF